MREPGGAFRETPAVPSGEEGLHENERLLGVNRPPLVAALHEASGGAGALVVPVGSGGVDSGVLHWDGKAWTRETIELPATVQRTVRSDRARRELAGQCLAAGAPLIGIPD